MRKINIMRKTNKMKKANNIFFMALAACILFTAPSYASVCNSPCPNPCVPSQTVCEGTNCTTYCGVSRTAVRTYVSPGVSFSYFGSNGSVSFSESYVGYYSPGLSITLGDRFHRPPRYPYMAKPRPPIVQIKPPISHRPNMNPPAKPNVKPNMKPHNLPKKPISANKPSQRPSQKPLKRG